MKKGVDFDENDNEYTLRNRSCTPSYIEQELARVRVLSDDLRWRAALDWFTGQNYHARNHTLAILIARTCVQSNPCADFLVRLADERKEWLMGMLHQLAADIHASAKAPPVLHLECMILYLSAMQVSVYTTTELRISRLTLAAESGYGPAQVALSRVICHTSPGTSERWLIKAYEQGDVLGISLMGDRFRHPLTLSNSLMQNPDPPFIGPEDAVRANALLSRAAALGDVFAQTQMISYCFSESNLLGAAKYAVLAEPYYPSRMHDTIDRLCGFAFYLASAGVWPALYLLGKTVHGHIWDDGRQAVYGQIVDVSSIANCVWVSETAIKWDNATRDACHAWTVCAKRIAAFGRYPLCKDVRIMISQMIWYDHITDGWPPEFCRDQFSVEKGTVHANKCVYSWE